MPTKCWSKINTFSEKKNCHVLEDRNKGWWKNTKKKSNGQVENSHPEAKKPHEMVLIWVSQALSTVLITSLTAMLIALAKELGT